METDRSYLCGCKGIRTCLKCEQLFDIPSKNISFNSEDVPVYVYCPLCNNFYEGMSASDNPHPSHTGNSRHIDGIYVKENFLSEKEECELLQSLDALPWDLSQSGRRKQNFGPKCNFKKRKIRVGDFNGFPASTKFVQEKFKSDPLLHDYQTIEQCSLEYDPDRGASIDPHIDDCWIWGERIVTVNLLSDSTLTLLPYKGDLTKYNLSYAPKQYVTPSCVDIALRIPMPRRSLIVLTGEARYAWEHQVFRKDIKERRVCLAYREFTSPYLPGGSHENEGHETLEKAKLFW